MPYAKIETIKKVKNELDNAKGRILKALEQDETLTEEEKHSIMHVFYYAHTEMIDRMNGKDF